MISFDPNQYFFWLIVVSTLCFALERTFPWRGTQAAFRKGFGQDLFWLFFNGHFAALILAVPVAWLLTHIRAVLLAVHLSPPEAAELLTGTPPWVQLTVLFVVQDFLQWCIHNLLHRVPWLWQFHKVHHSIEELDWIGNFRFHWMELVVYRGLTYLPLAILGVDGRVLLVNAVIGTLFGHLNHANLRLDWGPFKYVLNSPRFHVWHHDRILRSGKGTNYAIVLSIWDWIFGTAYWPGGNKQPAALGFEGDDYFPSSLVGRFTYPVLRWLRKSS